MLLAAARPCPFTWQTQSRCLLGRCTDVASWRRGPLCCRGWSPGFRHTATPETRSLNTSENNYVFYGFVSRPEPHTLFTVRFLHFLCLHGCCLNGRTYKTSIRRTDAILSHSAFSREAWIILFIPHCIQSKAWGRDKCCFFVTLFPKWDLLRTVWFSPLSTGHKHVPINSVIVSDQLAPGRLDIISFPFITFLKRKLRWALVSQHQLERPY